MPGFHQAVGAGEEQTELVRDAPERRKQSGLHRPAARRELPCDERQNDEKKGLRRLMRPVPARRGRGGGRGAAGIAGVARIAMLTSDTYIQVEAQAALRDAMRWPSPELALIISVRT